MALSIQYKDAPQKGFIRLTLAGCGPASGVPVVGHFKADGCVCGEALENPSGPNVRNVSSLLITIQKDGAVVSDEERPTASPLSHSNFTTPLFNTLQGKPVSHVLVNCSKSFRDAYFTTLILSDVRVLDGLFLTDGSPSALGGVDDLRDLQSMSSNAEGKWFIHHFIPTYLLRSTEVKLKAAMPYIVNNGIEMKSSSSTRDSYETALSALKKERGADWNCIGIRRSTALQLVPVEEAEPSLIYVQALGDYPVYAIPLSASGSEVSMGLAMGSGIAFKDGEEATEGKAAAAQGGACVVYLSNTCGLPAGTLAFLKKLVKIDVLFIDCLHGPGVSSSDHFCFDDVVSILIELKPVKAVTTGMSCDIRVEETGRQFEEEMNRAVLNGKLSESEKPEVIIGSDGFSVEVPL